MTTALIITGALTWGLGLILAILRIGAACDGRKW